MLSSCDVLRTGYIGHIFSQNIYSLIYLQTCQHAQQLIKYKLLLIDMNIVFFTKRERVSRLVIKVFASWEQRWQRQYLG